MPQSRSQLGADQGDTLERLIDLLGAYTSTVLTGRLLSEAVGGNLTPSQLDALAFVAHHGGCSTKTLSEGLRISIPSSTRLVDRLVRKRLVHRCESGEDRRRVELTLTPAGEQMLRAVNEARTRRLAQTLATLTVDEHEQLLSLLERVLLAAFRDEQTVEDCCLHCGAGHITQCVVNEAHLALSGRPIEHP